LKGGTAQPQLVFPMRSPYRSLLQNPLCGPVSETWCLSFQEFSFGC
jgi:hypothetical protein